MTTRHKEQTTKKSILAAAALPPRCRRAAAALPPRCRRAAAALPPRCRRAAAALPPRCRRAVAALPPRCRRAVAALSLLAAAATPSFAANGPVSKFNGMKPTAEYMSSANLEDIERCLIDMEGWRAPAVYRQPDRPNAVMLLWPDPSSLSAARMDLTRMPGGTRVKSWISANQARACSPQRLDR